VKQVRGESFTVSAKGTEHIYLPAIEIPAAENCRLEIELEPYSAPSILPRSLAVLPAEIEEMAVHLDVAAPVA